MSKPARLIMLSAMYENGGNTTHRMLDGHPELFVYPFESQVGTSLVADYFTSFVPFRYRWPEFPLQGHPAEDYELFYDEEMKVRLRTPSRSKFAHADLQLDEKERKQRFIEIAQQKPRTRGNLVMAFFEATFDTWRNVQRTGQEKYYVGYNPVQAIDTEKILSDLPDAHLVHIVRNPYSGYADTKKRPFPLSLSRYVWTWNILQHMALTFAERYPQRFHLLRFEDIIADPKKTLGNLCAHLGIAWSDTLLYPSWNGQRLQEVYPWGTVRIPTPEANIATLRELSHEERTEIRSLASVMLKHLGYDDL
ncbi:sulfotransferase family protein [Chthonomonas calidirosea]|uniref:Sulfotransferase family n=1 Tax=Chthonomonas calidirosea (strain DSM 23976 / ICMP 18418 / T49) TaxID=1303518 RepID=S0EYK8_CHTCT|nr:sulfotransferase [Chthonomonas calidirosea]CCW35478.1 hypothetical protein CCALI_01664 [Chthonomonas calidirosea T49]CEK19168.1 hypothetical protein CP488_02429 [Chthonomonas calidirosea]CEK20151.1 hypothetical protein CTKA_02432 [Chthonomonas calidirosea]